MVDSSLVLFSMFGLSAMHQEGFIIVIILFFTFIPFFCAGTLVYKKRVLLANECESVNPVSL